MPEENEGLTEVFAGAALEAELFRKALDDAGLACKVERISPMQARVLVPPQYSERAAQQVEEVRKELGGASDATISGD
jgi:hypothetical protein